MRTLSAGPASSGPRAAGHPLVLLDLESSPRRLFLRLQSSTPLPNPGNMIQNSGTYFTQHNSTKFSLASQESRSRASSPQSGPISYPNLARSSSQRMASLPTRLLPLVSNYKRTETVLITPWQLQDCGNMIAPTNSGIVFLRKALCPEEQGKKSRQI